MPKNTSNTGRSSKSATIAINIASIVSSPKYIVGMKLESVKIEKPITIIVDV